jgi:hypothetical protein
MHRFFDEWYDYTQHFIGRFTTRSHTRGFSMSLSFSGAEKFVGAVLTVTGSAVGGAFVTLMTAVCRIVRQRIVARRSVGDAKAMLGMQAGEGVAYRHDSVHPLYQEGRLHPDNLDAVRFAAGSELKRAIDLSQLRLSNAVLTVVEQNMVLLGSPTAEGMSRVVFGYREEEPDRLVLSQPPVDLPYFWQLDKGEIRGQALRYVRGVGVVSRPNWHIVSQRLGNPALYIPEVNAEGFPATDFLLVTRLRNFLTSAATDQGRYIVSVGGAHGTATRTIGLLLNDRAALTKIADSLKGRPQSYQLLLRVSGMRHDMNKGTQATTIELIDAVALPDERRIWQAASQTIEPQIAEWLGQQTTPQTSPRSRRRKNSRR